MKFVLIGLALLAILLVAAVAVVAWMGMPKGPSLEEVAHLRTPQILQMESEKVILVKAKGNPNLVGKGAFGLLMKTFFGLKGVPKGGPSMVAPRARWQIDAGIPMDEWEGLYAMPVPESVSELPARESSDGLTVELATWEYGEVAQVLHVGRWDQETENIQALHGFIRSQGYEISGPHEEEYIKGPGFLFAGNPDKYLTLIRYQVRKIEF